MYLNPCVCINVYSQNTFTYLVHSLPKKTPYSQLYDMNKTSYTGSTPLPPAVLKTTVS